ncbi:molybdopterin-dependent oxidoreductase [Streptomyces zingiberis]|uniref:Molybdopterin-dependent oxidoreductase n=1 Tax=Streptomyces zingiberis TaxID=2053010 RepID=A0ABX1BZA7_9ACTN|nr:molybdopterin-dependent oxidoreductase [Streptomyces zingiberis]NJQ01653.1 molybdopterin-dependent oxidoreductase [Streptomyces zingiberis]
MDDSERPARPADGPRAEDGSPAPAPRARPPALRGPFRPGFWRSPLRGPWLTSVLGAVLLPGIVVLFLTGLLSYAAYNPGLPGNDTTPDKGLLGVWLFPWPTEPYWLYRFTQGVHVTLGVALVPVLLAKVWSVAPRLFTWPPARSLTHALDRVSLLFLVGGGLFVFATGILNIQLEYLFPGSFYRLHFYGAWVFMAAFTVHAAVRLPRVVRVLRGRPARTAEEDASLTALAAPDPEPATLSRRGALAVVGGGSLLLAATTAGQSAGGPLRATAVLAPRGREPGTGPNGFQINKTAAAAGISAADTGPDWRLTVRGGTRDLVLSRAELLALPQREAELPIACVEGWSTPDLRWSGVRLADLAALAGAVDDGGGPAGAPGVFVESAQRGGAFRSASLSAGQVRDPRALLALRVGGAGLSADHGYPARIIVPANPGVHNTKWVTRLTFGGGR